MPSQLPGGYLSYAERGTNGPYRGGITGSYRGGASGPYYGGAAALYSGGATGPYYSGTGYMDGYPRGRKSSSARSVPVSILSVL